MDQVTILDIITLIIAVYGAGLSTIITFKKIKRDKRKATVECFYKERTLDKNGNAYRKIVALKAVNSGHRPINLENCGFKTDDGKYLPSRSSRLPKVLEDGESIEIPFKIETLNEWFESHAPNERIHSGYFRDAEGDFYNTKNFPSVMHEEQLVKKKWYKF